MGGKYRLHDPYFLQAKKEGYRSRAAYKLKFIQDKFKVLKSGDHVLDLGAAPGGFLQVAAEIVGRQGFLVGVDISPIAPLPRKNVVTLQTDVAAAGFPEKLNQVHPAGFDVVLSDLAPQTTGIASVDKTRSIVLAREVLALSLRLLKPGGHQVVKVLEGPDYHEYLKEIKLIFSKVNGYKPPVTRKGSSEVYVIARGLKAT